MIYNYIITYINYHFQEKNEPFKLPFSSLISYLLTYKYLKPIQALFDLQSFVKLIRYHLHYILVDFLVGV